jgi:palmitoyltransferase
VGLEVTGSLVDGQGHSALLLAASQGHLEAVKIIREAPETDLCAADAFGRTLTHWAAKWGWNDLIRQIGSVNAVTTGGDSPLHWAALEGRLDTVETLLELGADPRIKNNRGESPGDLCANIDVKESIQRSLDKFVSEEATKVSVDLVKPTKAKALNLSSAPKRQKLKFKLRTN